MGVAKPFPNKEHYADHVFSNHVQLLLICPLAQYLASTIDIRGILRRGIGNASAHARTT